MSIQFSTLWSQDSVRVAYVDLKEILILASKGEAVDSLIYHYDFQIEIKESIIELKNDQLKLAGELIARQSILISDLQAKLSESERKRKNLKTILWSAVGIIGIETLILFI